MERELELRFIAELTASPDATTEARLCASLLTAEDFSDEYARTCWGAIRQILDDGQMLNVGNFFASMIRKGHKPRLDIMHGTGFGVDIAMMAATIHDGAVKRRLSEAIRNVALDLEDPTTSSIEALAKLNAAMEEAGKQNDRKVTEWAELYKQVLKRIEDRANNKEEQGTPTGYSLIDEEGGMTDGALVIVAGRTSNGKTAFALNMALNVASRNVPVMVYSLEMTNEQLGGRLLANLSGVPQAAIKSGQLDAEMWGKVTNTDDSLPMYFDDGRATSKDSIFNSIRNVAETKGVKVVFIDYLQLVRGNGRDRRQDISDIANELKVLAVQLGITIVLLSQLAREQKGLQPVPRINELKESGEIENAADAVYLVYRPEQHGPDVPFPDMSRRWSDYSTEGNALLICAKNRNGKTGEQLLGWDGETSRFFERDRYELKQPTTDKNTFTRLC